MTKRYQATFRGFLGAQTGREDPVGDLARLAFGGACPGGCRFTTWATLTRHLAVDHDVVPATFAAARQARREFRARGGVA